MNVFTGNVTAIYYHLNAIVMEMVA